MKYKFNCRDLILEVTRRCNMGCEHCLRGCPENRDMDKETVDKILDYVSSIGTLTLSGGEPTLNLPLMQYIFDEIHRRNIPMDGFYVVTNGKVNQMDLAVMLLRQMEYVGDPDYCGVAVSKDIYHEDLDSPSPVQHLAFYRKEKEMGDFRSGDALIQRGRAMNFGIGRDEQPTIDLPVGDVTTEGDTTIITVDGNLYVSCLGDICADCDLSYDMMTYYSAGDLDTIDELFENLIEDYEAEE